MELAAVIGTFAGLLMPRAVAALTRAHWPWEANLAVAFGSSVVLGTVDVWAAGELTSTRNWATIVGLVFASSQAAYYRWWRPRQGRDDTGGNDGAAA